MSSPALPALPAGRPVRLGHRGARNYAAENTLAAFDLALQHGCDGFEFDVRCTADAQAVICHDAEFVGADIAAAAYADLSRRASEQLSRVLYETRGALPEAMPLPLLNDVLARFATAWLDIELKVARLEAAIVAALQIYRPPAFLVSSFLPDVLVTLHGFDPFLPLGLICDSQRRLARWTSLPVGTVLPKRSLVSQALIEELHSAGKKVMIWTVNDEREMLQFAEWGADGLISDDTLLLGRVFHLAG